MSELTEGRFFYDSAENVWCDRERPYRDEPGLFEEVDLSEVAEAYEQLLIRVRELEELCPNHKKTEGSALCGWCEIY